ncbi:HNH endonuclease [Ectothiorhodospiraceae bacterium 2226]|nr:HNH endonuclease [Ectothiorhodospiraceae bacterium 2226]
MIRDEILQAFESVRVWRKQERRAVHKPLLILMELGRIARGEPARISYAEAEPQLMRLLAEFGPSGAVKSRHYPFWHLQSDGLWELHGPDRVLDRPAGATPNIGELREHDISGQLAPRVRDALTAHPDLLAEVAQRIVSAHFPASIQRDVLDAVGLTVPVAPGVDERTQRRRDPRFRDKVLLAYEYRCCLCGHDIRLNNQVIGLEAAHIKWFQAGGPDVESNGLALCSLHHKIFDLGAFTVRPRTLEVVFSRHVVGSPQIQARLLAYHGAALIPPQSEQFLPTADFLKWHEEEVFKRPARQ